MKALGVTEVPSSADGEWIGEIKFDGYRALAVLNHGKVQLWSRNHKPLDYPEVTPPLKSLRCKTAVIDGEIVALDAEGRSHFQTLQGRDLGERPTIVLYAFDLLHLNGTSLVNEPLPFRRKALEALIKKPSRTLQLSPIFDVSPADLLAAAKQQGLEGIILKHRESLYEVGRRSGSWLKIKNLNEQEFVIGGFTPPQNSRQHFGALLVGYYQSGKLLYAGKVGTGFTGTMLRNLHERFQPLTTETCPFANLPLDHRSRFGQGMTRSVMRTVTWLKPKLVAQIKFAEWTEENLLRQPVFLGLRKDKAAKAVRREASL
ncbi:MAG TPA: non-homologous end-joining DNA ligase [Opitutaceae bacterium]|nr:non-homologous end-joining DNA ligase [Opitutaceae bacterium]